MLNKNNTKPPGGLDALTSKLNPKTQTKTNSRTLGVLGALTVEIFTEFLQYRTLSQAKGNLLKQQFQPKVLHSIYTTNYNQITASFATYLTFQAYTEQ